ncbi:unnamed protein product [Mytilus coruscus]|uniref:Uncharacterized protein n=1 Tax=Mytilus coruscus TaxID=42192 RepID=A0A6J8AWH5_MYTCO|nr:unnamed protein product [Mytilus coruscus]
MEGSLPLPLLRTQFLGQLTPLGLFHPTLVFLWVLTYLGLEHQRHTVASLYLLRLVTPCLGLDLLGLRVILTQVPGQGFHGQGFPGQGFPNQVFPSQVPGQPFPGFWPYCGPITTPVIVPQSITSNLSVPAPPLAVSSSSCSSVSVPAALPTSSVRHQFNQVTDSGPSLDGFKSILDDFRQSISSELTSFSNRLGTLDNIANKSNSPVISLLSDHNIGIDPEDRDEEERFSVAPGSQEEGFTSDEEGDNPVQVSQNVSQPSVPVSISSSVIGRSTNSSKDPEAEDTPSILKDLRDSVYTIMRDVNKVPFQYPPRPKRLTSNFEASCGLSIDNAKSHTSFPQSNHMSTSLQIINDGIVANASQFSQMIRFSGCHLMMYRGISIKPQSQVNVSLSGNNSKRGSYASAGGSSYNSQEKRRKMTNKGGNKPKKSSIPRSKPNSFKRGGEG